MKAIAIPQFKLVPHPVSEEAKQLPGFKWAGREVGTRHQLGGRPSERVTAVWPACPDCGEPMTFYGQLDSINDEFCVMDAGVICVFMCFDCNEVAAVIDSG